MYGRLQRVLLTDVREPVEALLAHVLGEFAKHEPGIPGMHSVGGWHSRRFPLGDGVIGAAMLARIEASGYSLKRKGSCWANVLPKGASYGKHRHVGHEHVAVWCLTDSEGVLHVEGAEPVRDIAGQLVIFAGEREHWVEPVPHARVTVAANLALDSVCVVN